MCINLNLLVLEIEIDATVFFEWVNESCSNNLYYIPLIKDYRNPPKQIPPKIQHRFRYNTYLGTTHLFLSS